MLEPANFVKLKHTVKCTGLSDLKGENTDEGGGQ